MTPRPITPTNQLAKNIYKISNIYLKLIQTKSERFEKIDNSLIIIYFILN